MRLSSLVVGSALLLYLMHGMAGACLAAPRTVVTIKPIHSLVAGVMSGVGTPVLLVTGAGSPHGHVLKPSQARALAAADLVVWVGPEMESFFIKPAASFGEDSRLVTLLAHEGLIRLRAREGGAWDSEHGHDAGDRHDGFDPHIWLDPANARVIVKLLAEKLSEIDVENAASYRGNADRMILELTALERDLAALIAPLRGIPFVVFHDAYQYFEARFGVNAIGSISVSPERRPSARRLVEMRARLTGSGAVCLFTEPQFPAKLADTVREGTTVKISGLDPLGASIEPGPKAYATLMRNLAASLRTCLAG